MSTIRERTGAAAAPVLECRGVGRRFLVRRAGFGRRVPLLAVQDVNLELRRGEVLAVVGESGCGKSTLAKLLLGVHQPTTGKILFNGEHLSEIDRKTLGRRIQPVFQDPYTSLNPRKTAAQIIGLPLLVHGIGDKTARRDRVVELMGLCGLTSRLYHAYPSQLSGGQRQRVAIARALAVNPAVVICDEPTSALDVSVQAQILKLLESLKSELALTYLFISHDLSVVEHIADRVAVMYFGRIVEVGTAQRVFEQPMHPYTRALLDADLRLDADKGPGASRLGGAVPDPLEPPAGCAFHPRCPDARPQCKRSRPPAVRVGEDFVECVLHE